MPRGASFAAAVAVVVVFFLASAHGQAITVALQQSTSSFSDTTLSLSGPNTFHAVYTQSGFLLGGITAVSVARCNVTFFDTRCEAPLSASSVLNNPQISMLTSVVSASANALLAPLYISLNSIYVLNCSLSNLANCSAPQVFGGYALAGPQFPPAVVLHDSAGFVFLAAITTDLNVAITRCTTRMNSCVNFTSPVQLLNEVVTQRLDGALDTNSSAVLFSAFSSAGMITVLRCNFALTACPATNISAAGVWPRVHSALAVGGGYVFIASFVFTIDGNYPIVTRCALNLTACVTTNLTALTGPLVFPNSGSLISLSATYEAGAPGPLMLLFHQAVVTGGTLGPAFTQVSCSASMSCVSTSPQPTLTPNPYVLTNRYLMLPSVVPGSRVILMGGSSGVVVASCRPPFCQVSCPSVSETSYIIGARGTSPFIGGGGYSSQLQGGGAGGRFNNGEIGAGSTFVLRVATANAGGLVSRCESTLFSVLDGPGGNLLPSTTTDVNSTVYDLALMLTKAGLYNFVVLVNGAAIPDPFPLYVAPLLPSGANTVVSVPTVVFVGESFGVTVNVRDIYGNAANTSADKVVSAALSFGTTTLAQLALYRGGLGEFEALMLAPEIHIYTLQVRIGPAVVASLLLPVGFRCEPGSFHRLATDTCNLCAPNSYANISNAAACAPCPPNSVTAGPGAAFESECVCAPGTFLYNDACQTCPIEANCAGGTAQPVAKAGYFGTSDPTVFLSCPVPSACLGGANNACARGYRGTLCADCAPGYYHLRGRCLACNRALSTVVIIAIVALLLGLIAWLVWLNLQDVVTVFAAAMISYTALQICATFGKLNLPWGDLANSFLNAVSFVNLNFELTSPECSLARNDPLAFQFALMMSVPALAAIGFGVVFLVAHTCKGRWKTLTSSALADACKRGFTQILVLIYLPLVSTALQIFGCARDRSRRWVLLAAPSRSCYTAPWMRMMIPSVVFILLYGVGIPALVLTVLVRNRRRLDSLLFNLRFSFLVARFTETSFYYEIVIMGTKLALVIAMTVFTTDASKANVAVVLLALATIHVARARPYLVSWHNSFAIGVMALTTAVLYSALIVNSLLRSVLLLSSLFALLLAAIAGTAYDTVMAMRGRRESAAMFLAVKDERYDATDSTQTSAITSFGDSNEGVSMTMLGPSYAHSGMMQDSSGSMFGGSAGGGYDGGSLVDGGVSTFGHGSTGVGSLTAARNGTVNM